MESCRPVPERLNRECFCITLDRGALGAELARQAGDPEFWANIIGSRPHLFSDSPVFLSARDRVAMVRTVEAIEAATRLPGYREAALSWAPEIARHSFGPLAAERDHQVDHITRVNVAVGSGSMPADCNIGFGHRLRQEPWSVGAACVSGPTAAFAAL